MKNLVYIFILISLTIFSCKRDRTEVADTIESAEDNSTAENEMVSLFDVAEDLLSSNNKTRSNGTILPSGAKVTFMDSLFNDGNGVELLIDFGPLKTTFPKGLLCLDGRFRAGKLHLKLNKRYFSDSVNIEVWANDNDEYYAGNDHESLSKITGKLNLLKIQERKWILNVTDAKITNERGTVTWTSQRVIEKMVDDGPGLINDEFKVTGTAKGINRNGDSFEVTVDEPLYKIVKLPCARTFVDGKITLKNLSNSKTLTIDYDPYNNKACDIVAKATINNKEFYFNVR